MPARTIASISSEVATGRWMKGRDGLIARRSQSRGGRARPSRLRLAGAVAVRPAGAVGRRARAVLACGARVARAVGRGGGGGSVGAGVAPMASAVGAGAAERGAARAAGPAARARGGVARQLHLRAVLQAVAALGDHALAELQALGDLHAVDRGDAL